MHTICYIIDLTGRDFSAFLEKLMLEPKPGEILIDYSSGRPFDVPEYVLPGSIQAIVDGNITVLFSQFSFAEFAFNRRPNDQRIRLERQILDMFPNCFLLRTKSGFFDDFSVHHSPLWYFDFHLIELFYHRLQEKNPMFWSILNDQPRKTKEYISEKLGGPCGCA